MENHPIIWTAPEPLWKEAANTADPERAPMAAPAILRFATDDFMQEFLAVLATDPHRLGEYRVVPETWRGMLTTQTTFSPKKLFALPFQRFAAARQRLTGHAPPNQGRKPGVGGDPEEMVLKLYQPAHQRYYLVTSSLVCRLAGLPDRKVDAGKQEQSGFVMRRLLKPQAETDPHPASWPEHAWVENEGGRYWKMLTDAEKETLPAGEEVLPLFSANHTQDDQRQRRMLVGLIPVGKREAYLAGVGGPENSSGGVTPLTARKALLRKEVIEPWKGLLRDALRQRLAAAASRPVPASPQKERDLLKILREQIQTASWYILADFARFIEDQLPEIWQVISDKAPESELAKTADQNLMNALQNAALGSNVKTDLKRKSDLTAHPFYSDASLRRTLLEALKEFSRGGTSSPGAIGSATSVPQSFAFLRLEAATGSYDREKAHPANSASPDPTWPDFLFPLVDPGENLDQAPVPASGLSSVPDSDDEFRNAGLLDKPILDTLKELEEAELAEALRKLDKLAVLVLRSVALRTPKTQPAVPLAAKQPADALEGWFVIRCVYSRPLCGKLHNDAVSAPTRHFQLAGFFDPDAPARPIRIGLPIDTTPAGLRKFDRNTAFIISDTLCGQIARMKGITFGDLVMSILPWPFHRDLNTQDKGPCGFGMMCSLSIPIITLCALILLMIMVALLDMVFHWLPFFILCFPLPGLKAKKP
jgi:hypothetical protein